MSPAMPRAGPSPGRLEAWRSSMRTLPRCVRSVACGAAKKGKEDAAAAGPAAAMPPGALPPPPTVAPPPPKRAAPLRRQSYRRRRKTADEYRAERRAAEAAAAAAAQGVTLWLDDPGQLLQAHLQASGAAGGGGAGGRRGPRKLIIIDGYNFLNASPRYSAAAKSGRLAAARAALQADLEALAAASGGEAAALVVYDAMGFDGAGGGGGAAARERAVGDAMAAVAARFPPHSVPGAHRLREMALAELGGGEGGEQGGGSSMSGGGGDAGGGVEWASPGVAVVFSRGCEADTWILDELDGARSPAPGARAAWRARWGPGLEGVVVVSDDRRVADGVLFAAMSSIEVVGGGGEGGAEGGGGALGARGAPSLAARPCAWLGAELDARRRRGRGGGAGDGAERARARCSGPPRRRRGHSSGYSSESDAGWADGDYDVESGGEGEGEGDGEGGGPPPAAAALTPRDVAALLDQTGDALAAAGADLDALLGLDLGGDLP
ncbi:MAG: hypothetical protein J3K34DRAFT_506863 [Monoraphidium minutum]|nr:MAG: hypothetical protein J3K34DRAFT_506863 [Monoraphidium minutum]